MGEGTGRCSVVACATCKREIASWVVDWTEVAVDAVLLRQCLYPCIRAPSRFRSKSGYLDRERVKLCIWLVTCTNLSLRGCMLPGELRWLINEQGPVSVTREQILCKVRREALVLDAGYKPPPLPLAPRTGECRPKESFQLGK